MTLYSKGDNSNIAIPLYVNLEDTFSEENHSMFRIVLVESGTGILKINNRSFVFMSPSVFCLNERDKIALEKERSVKAQVVYFDPSIINSSFTLENVYNIDGFDKFTNVQDYFYLEPFLNRTKSTSSYYEIGLTMYKRTSELFKMLYEETNPCEGTYWVCRSRSFFLEILFLIQ
jgi:AraC family L-rhamnose operon regulatory protein RhaS